MNFLCKQPQTTCHMEAPCVCVKSLQSCLTQGLWPTRLLHPTSSWGGLPCPPPGDLPHPGMEPASPASLAGGLFTTSAPWPPLPDRGQLGLAPQTKRHPYLEPWARTQATAERSTSQAQGRDPSSGPDVLGPRGCTWTHPHQSSLRKGMPASSL